MKRWIVKTKSNKVIDETMMKWDEINEDIIELSFDNNGQIINLPKNMEKYIQGKTAEAFVGSNYFSIESRYIGFQNNELIYKIRINEKNNNITIEAIKV